MATAVSFVENVIDKKKQFACALAEITGLPEIEFKINEVAALFSFSSASIALHNLKGGSLAGRLPFKDLSGLMENAVLPAGIRKSVLSDIWRRSKTVKSPDEFRWGDLREIKNYLAVDLVALVPIFEKIETFHHEFARQLSILASGGVSLDTLFKSDDASSAHVKVDSGAPECTKDSSPPTVNPAGSEEPSSGAPDKASGRKRRTSPRTQKKRDKPSRKAPANVRGQA